MGKMVREKEIEDVERAVYKFKNSLKMEVYISIEQNRTAGSVR